MTPEVNMLNWFEIPVADMDRAKKFYETIFDIQMPVMEMMGMKTAFFPGGGMNGKVSGGLAESPQHTPSQDGAKIYLNGNPDLSIPLSKVEAAGGKVVMPKTKISDEIGYMAFFVDTEGNAGALHSNN